MKKDYCESLDIKNKERHKDINEHLPDWIKKLKELYISWNDNNDLYSNGKKKNK